MKRFTLLSLAFISFGFVTHAEEETRDYIPVKLQRPLESTIPNDLRPLLMEDPKVKFNVVVDPQGKISDYLAIEATHFGLLERAEQRLQEAKFDPATTDGVPDVGFITVYIHFYDPEQRLWQSGAGMTPMGSGGTGGLERMLYEGNPGRYVYQESKPNELDSTLKIIQSKFVEVRPPEDEPKAEGKVVAEYYVDHTGEIRLPKILSSDNEYLSMSVLATLKETRFAPPTKNQHPTFVRVRQPFNFKKESAQ